MSYPANARSATVNASSNGANTVIAAAPGKVIRVLSYVLVCAGAVSCTWESDGGTILAGPMPFAANGGAAPPKDQDGHFDTLSGEGLVLFLSSGVQVGGHVKYLIGL
jgi:hypothetical protein